MQSPVDVLYLDLHCVSGMIWIVLCQSRFEDVVINMAVASFQEMWLEKYFFHLDGHIEGTPRRWLNGKEDETSHVFLSVQLRPSLRVTTTWLA